MRNVLYDVMWQKLRVSCLSVNHPSGGFTTVEGTKDNLERLNNYIFTEVAYANIPVEGREEERAARVWRTLNLLNATRMGYQGQHLAGSMMDEAVRVYRDSLQPHYDPHKVQAFDKHWDWPRVQRDLEALWRNERYWFTAIYTDLKARRDRNIRRKGESATVEHRGELVRFLNLMEEVNLHG